MHTLTIALPNVGTVTLTGHCTFREDLHATIVHTLQENNSSCVYRVDLSNGYTASVKMSFDAATFEEVKNEDNVYTNLIPQLQGTVILRQYGFYFGPDATGRNVGCHMGEDCEGEIGCKLAELPPHEKLEIVQLLGRMHQAGVQPMVDLSGGNIVRVKTGGFRIVHLYMLQLHECEWDGDWHVGEEMPRLSEFKCSTLYSCGQQLGVWKQYQFPVVYVDGQAYLDINIAGSTTVITEVVEEREG